MPAGKLENANNQIKNIYACCIGINQYNRSKGINLEGCVRDAEAILNAFEISKKNIDLITNERASRKYILEIVAKYVKKIQKKELFIFSFSGHGAIVNKDLAITPADFENENQLGTVLSTLYLITALSTISEKGGRVLIILDICHSGALNFDLSKYSGALSGGGMSAIYACGPNEKAWEKPFGANGERQGVFTKHLIDGLNGACKLKGDRLITLRNLFDYIYDKVCEEDTGQPQHPALIGTLEGDTVLRTI